MGYQRNKMQEERFRFACRDIKRFALWRFLGISRLVEKQ